MRSTSLVFGISLLILGGIGCGSSSSTPPVDAVMSNFMAVPPCNAETDYMTGNMVTFVMNDAKYAPKCLKVSKGAMVTFKADGGTFEHHPLKPSTKRGDKTNNPITMTATGTMAAFTFPNPGQFAYFCSLHGFTDTGTGTMMDGVVWVTP